MLESFFNKVLGLDEHLRTVAYMALKFAWLKFSILKGL